MADLAEVHQRAVRAVGELLSARGFDCGRFHGKPGERIRVNSYNGNPFRRVQFVNLQVHGSTQPPTCAVLASDRPIDDPKEVVVCCWLGEPSGRRFLFLSNQEAQKLWHKAGTRAFYWTNEDLPKPDDESIRKIIEVGGP